MAYGDPSTQADEVRPRGVRTGVASTRDELNNDLGAVVGYAERLLQDPELPPHLREHVAAILRSAVAAQTALASLRQTTAVDLSD